MPHGATKSRNLSYPCSAEIEHNASGQTCILIVSTRSLGQRGPPPHQTMTLALSSAFQGVSSTAGDSSGGSLWPINCSSQVLAFSTSNDRLRELFAQAGAVDSAAVVMDRDTGRSRGARH
jgi:RNA recognition motif-containing protein